MKHCHNEVDNFRFMIIWSIDRTLHTSVNFKSIILEARNNMMVV